MGEARSDEWPRSAPVVLSMLALVAAGAAAAVVMSAAGRSAAAGLAAGGGAVAGALATGLAIAYVRHARRTGSFDLATEIAMVIGSVLVTLVVSLVAWFAHGALSSVAIAALAGEVVGMTVGSLLWRRSVIRGERARR